MLEPAEKHGCMNQPWRNLKACWHRENRSQSIPSCLSSLITRCVQHDLPEFQASLQMCMVRGELVTIIDRDAVKRHQSMSLTAVTAQQSMLFKLCVWSKSLHGMHHVFPRWDKIDTWHELSWIGMPPLKFFHVGSEISAAIDKRSTGYHHSCFPTLSQQWVQLVTTDINLATQRGAGLHIQAPANRFIGAHAWSYVMVCGALTSDWYSCIRKLVASATRSASTGTCHGLAASNWPPKRDQRSAALPGAARLSLPQQTAGNPQISSPASRRWLCCLAGELPHRPAAHHWRPSRLARN